MKKVKRFLLNCILPVLLVGTILLGTSGCSDEIVSELISSALNDKSRVATDYETTNTDDTTADETEIETGLDPTTSGYDETTETEETAAQTSQNVTSATTTRTTTTTTTTTTTATTTTTTTTTAAPTPSYTISISTPSATNTTVSDSSGIFVIDYGNASRGYVRVYNNSSISQKAVVMIKNPDGTTSQCDFVADQWNTYLLTQGAGSYTVMVYQNTSDSSYSKRVSQTVTSNTSVNQFVYTSSKVEFSASTNAVKLAYELTAGYSSTADKVNALYAYVKNNISYDYAKRDSGATTRYPNCDTTLSKMSGVCSDYANLLAVMCRAIGVPARLVFGYYDHNNDSSYYHAWNQIYYDGSWHFYDATIGLALSTGSHTYYQKEIY